MKLPEGYHAFRVPIPNNPLGFLLSYLIEGRDGHTLIDTGWDAPEAYESLIAQLGEAGLDLKDVRQIILTHMHPDHSGLANQIRRESGAKVFMHRLDAETISHALRIVQATAKPDWTARFENLGVPPQISANTHFRRGRFRNLNLPEPDVILSGGEIVDAGDTKLEVIWTPGHAAGHVCLYDRENRILFSGDHVLPVTTPHVTLLWSSDEHHDPLGDYLASLEKVRPLEADVVLPAHDHIFEDLQGRLEEIERHHDVRLLEMHESANGGWVTPFDVAQRVSWTIGPFHSLEDHHKVMAVGETLAHLEFLQRRGRLTRRKDNGSVFYSQNGSV